MVKRAKEGAPEAAKQGEWKERFALYLGIAALLVVMVVIFVNLSAKAPPKVDLKFGFLPGSVEKAVVLTASVPVINASTEKDLESLFRLAAKMDVPLTLFVGVDPEVKEFRDYIEDSPRMKNDLSVIRDLQARFGVVLDIESLGYPVGYASLPYEYKERLILQAVKAFKAENISVKGFRPWGGFDYDTLLAAENVQVDFVSVISGASIQPSHPKSPLGIDMRLMIFPVYGRSELVFNESGAYVFALDLDRMGEIGPALEQLISEAEQEEGLEFMDLRLLDDYIRKVERMEALVTTDPKRRVTDISITRPLNGSKVEIRTDSVPEFITVSDENKTAYPMQGGFYFLITEKDRSVYIKWEDR